MQKAKERIQHAHKFVVPETTEYTLGSSDRRRKRDLREIRCESVDWFHLSTERIRLQAPVNTEITASRFKMARNFSTGNRSTISLSNLLYSMTLINQLYEKLRQHELNSKEFIFGAFKKEKYAGWFQHVRPYATNNNRTAEQIFVQYDNGQFYQNWLIHVISG